MMNLNAETAMNLVGLILIAALSSGIVAVSLRLRASTSSAGPWLRGDCFPEEDWREPTQIGAQARRGLGFKIRPALRASREFVVR